CASPSQRPSRGRRPRAPLLELIELDDERWRKCQRRPLSTYTRHRAMLPEQLFLLDLGASALFLLALKAMSLPGSNGDNIAHVPYLLLSHIQDYVTYAAHRRQHCFDMSVFLSINTLNLRSIMLPSCRAFHAGEQHAGSLCANPCRLRALPLGTC